MDPFEDCLTKGRLKQMDVDVERVATELETAREELTRARACYTGGNWGEATTQAYFALFRTARAAINSQGYRDTNLYGLLAGLRKLFVETDKIPGKFIDYIRDAKDIKDVIYEGGRANRRDARQVLGWALAFVRIIFGILALPGFEAESIDTTLPEPLERGDGGQPRSSEDDWRRRPGPPRGRGGYGARDRNGYGGRERSGYGGRDRYGARLPYGQGPRGRDGNSRDEGLDSHRPRYPR